jgi:multidrug efflux pump subunit AcrA (membrane-fusion protein)
VTFAKVVGLALMFLLLYSCGTKMNVEKQKQAVVHLRKIHAEQICNSLYYPARVRAKLNAIILSETDGIITNILVTIGNQIKKNQALMILKHTDPVYQYAPVRILSPIEGVVSSIDITQGSHVIQKQRLGSVINPSQLEVQVEIPASDHSSIQTGMLGEFKVPTQDRSIQVQVLGVSPSVDPLTGTAPAQLSILTKDKPTLSPGTQGQVTFRCDLHTGILIPNAAVIYKGNETFVRVVENQKIRQAPILLGKKQLGNVEVLKGLSADTLIVERANRYVTEGEEVVIEGVTDSLKQELPKNELKKE